MPTDFSLRSLFPLTLLVNPLQNPLAANLFSIKHYKKIFM
jgi:hypothetical protein